RRGGRAHLPEEKSDGLRRGSRALCGEPILIKVEEGTMPDSNAAVADYVVVGAGTAGCILAARLSVDPNVRVALLECGGMDTNPAIYEKGLNPMFSLWNPQGAENWGYATTPQAGLGGRSIDIARGKVLGGSSAVN